MNKLELAERVQALQGPDREVDEAIAEALGWRCIPNPTHAGGLVGRWHLPGGAMSGHSGPPRYTASLDAAMTLVPEGCVFTVMTDFGLPGRARIYGSDRGWQADAATPALALCAAALKARALAEDTPNNREDGI